MSALEFTVLAENAEYRIEPLKPAVVMVIEKKTGNCKVVPWKTPVGDVRDAVAKFGNDKTISVYLKLAAKVEWSPMYKAA